MKIYSHIYLEGKERRIIVLLGLDDADALVRFDRFKAGAGLRKAKHLAFIDVTAHVDRLKETIASLKVEDHGREISIYAVLFGDEDAVSITLVAAHTYLDAKDEFDIWADGAGVPRDLFQHRADVSEYLAFIYPAYLDMLASAAVTG